MKYLDNLSKRLNKNQKTIVTTVVPLILFVIAMSIAGEHRSPFDFEETGLIWIIFLVLVGYFEFKMWGNQDIKNK